MFHISTIRPTPFVRSHSFGPRGFRPDSTALIVSVRRLPFGDSHAADIGNTRPFPPRRPGCATGCSVVPQLPRSSSGRWSRPPLGLTVPVGDGPSVDVGVTVRVGVGVSVGVGAGVEVSVAVGVGVRVGGGCPQTLLSANRVIDS